MARIKLAYIGGGSTRAAGTVASIIKQGDRFAGSEIVLIDLNPDRLALVMRIAEKMAACRGVDLRFSATTDRRNGLTDCDAVLTSFRPGGFEARHLDESIPKKHGVIGQETQGAGGFFMALRSITIMKGIVEDVQAVAPRARIFNYTNPVNLVAQAVTQYTDVPLVSLCEGPIYGPEELAHAAGLDPTLLDVASIGLNHCSWSVRARWNDEPFIPLLAKALPRVEQDLSIKPMVRRMMRLAVELGTIPNEYLMYYLLHREVLAEEQAKATTRSQDIMAMVPDYWRHYEEQAERPCPELDPLRSRGGIDELELAIDCMDAIYNDRKVTMPVNVPNRGVIADLPDEVVVETVGFVDRNGIAPLSLGRLPVPARGIVGALANYQVLAAAAAWHGTRKDAITALVSNPLCSDLPTAIAVYDELAAAHRQYLPERLLT